MTEAVRHPIRWVTGIWREIDAECIRERPAGLDYRPIVVYLLVAVSLTLQWYVGDREGFATWMPRAVRFGQYGELNYYAWWAGWRVLGFLVLPTIAVLLMPGERLRDYGWSIAGFTRHIGLYIGLYLAVLPLVYLMSRTHAFRGMYPFYRLSGRSTFDLVAWELLYAAQFLSLEFFFRGFMLQATKASLGVHSIWVMVVPYCMIHYGKTFVESNAAIVAGVVLGTIALRTRSIWGGIFVHIAVALTMDLLTVGYLPGRT